MKLIRRDHYLSRLLGLADTPEIKVITGVRRAGKSQLLKDLGAIRSKAEKVNVIAVDFLDLANESLKEYHALNDFVLGQTKRNCTNLLLLDEIQECQGFELAINSLQNSGKYDIYMTGSNAFLLSSDLATLFTGRQFSIPVLPFSFQEFALYHAEEPDQERLLDRYVTEGGLAGSYLYQREEDRSAYIREVYETILTRDLVQKFSLSNGNLLRHLSEYLMDNVSNLTNPNKTGSILCQNKIAANHVTAGAYMEALKQAFLFYAAKRYDIHGKRYLQSQEKFYLSDLGFRYAVLGRRNLDYGRALENIVYLELLRRGYEVYVGKFYALEVDFVALKGNEKIYFQVSYDLSSAGTRERELKSLLGIRDNYPKILLSRTLAPEGDYEGIRILNLADWLLGR